MVTLTSSGVQGVGSWRGASWFGMVAGPRLLGRIYLDFFTVMMVLIWVCSRERVLICGKYTSLLLLFSMDLLSLPTLETHSPGHK